LETVAGIERLTEEVERVLRGEYVGGVREVCDEVLIRGRKDGEVKRRRSSVDGEGKGRKGKRCVCM